MGHLVFEWNGEIGAGDLLVGVGTLLLASVTAWLAKRTSADVKLSAESVAIAREAIDEQAKPFLVATPEQPGFDLSSTYERGTEEPTGAAWLLYVSLENFGAGPAILDGVNLETSTGKNIVDDDWKVEEIYAPNVEAKSVGISLGPNEPPNDGEQAALRLLYRSAGGVRYETSHGLEIRENPMRAIRLDFRQGRL